MHTSCFLIFLFLSFFLLFIYLFKTFYAVVDGESFTEFCCSGKW